jgi:hypothetical protein
MRQCGGSSVRRSLVFETDQGVTTYSLNVGTGAVGDVGAPAGTSAATIGAVGKQDPVAALDAICSEIADLAAREARDLNPEELAAFRKASELNRTRLPQCLLAPPARTQLLSSFLLGLAPSASPA